MTKGELTWGKLTKCKLSGGELTRGELTKGKLIRGELTKGELIRGELTISAERRKKRRVGKLNLLLTVSALNKLGKKG